ncbi:MAG: hypothetical protein ACRETQ_10555 [Gammaproteobacteria bacterium]
MTRFLFFLLVVANLVALIWFGWLQSPVRSAPLAMPLSQVKPLRLVAALTPAERSALIVSAPAPQPVSGAVSSADTSCASYGPFPSAETAATGVARLQKDGAVVTQHTVPGKVRLGYWVYLPPFISSGQAESAAALMKQRGVKDLYIVTTEPNRNAISLGVYSDRYGALAHQKAIAALGYHPLVGERFRDAPRYWVEARAANGALPLAAVFADLATGDTTIGRAACRVANGN